MCKLDKNLYYTNFCIVVSHYSLYIGDNGSRVSFVIIRCGLLGRSVANRVDCMLIIRVEAG